MTSAPNAARASESQGAPRRTALRWVFALEYVLQGLGNPFQGLTYQPFFAHFRNHYGLSEAATQGLFAKSYLAWSFKPILGFLIDAYGRTRTALIVLLSLAIAGYLLAPLLDLGPMLFFGWTFALSVVLAATDVCVDRATVIAGDEDARATGRPKATAVGLNQSICWMAIYGTSMVAAVLGGYVAERVSATWVMLALAPVPLVVLVAVLRLPRDRNAPIPLSASLGAFWNGLHSGPILGVMLFFFIFHFQPALGPIWNNHLLESLRFGQQEIGISDAASYAGYFAGVVLFVRKGVLWQERVGLKKLFRLYILCAVPIRLTQYLLIDPYFSGVTAGIAQALPFLGDSGARMFVLCSQSFAMTFGISLMNMSTLSLVGAVVPSAAAGSLFAGFMSIGNLGYSMSYSAGAWLYEHGPSVGFLGAIDQALFGAPGTRATLAIGTLVLFNSLGYVLSFIAAHLLPDRAATLESHDRAHAGVDRWSALGLSRVRTLSVVFWLAGAGLFAFLCWAGLDFVSALVAALFASVLLRKTTLDGMLRSRT